jgi:hypothetical protein
MDQSLVSQKQKKRKKSKTSEKDNKCSQKPCSFFLEGNCHRSDCKFAHDLSTIPCKFWAEQNCFKGLYCPFMHALTPTLATGAKLSSSAPAAPPPPPPPPPSSSVGKSPPTSAYSRRQATSSHSLKEAAAVVPNLRDKLEFPTLFSKQNNVAPCGGAKNNYPTTGVITQQQKGSLQEATAA